MKKITQNLTNIKAWQSIVFAFMFLFSLTINAQVVGQEYLANPGVNTANVDPDTGFNGSGTFNANNGYGGWTAGTGGAFANGTDTNSGSNNGECHTTDRQFRLFKVGGADGQFINQIVTSLPAGNYNYGFWNKWDAASTTGAGLPTWSAEGDSQPKFTIKVQDADGVWQTVHTHVPAEPTADMTWVEETGTWTNEETRDVRVMFYKNGGTNAAPTNLNNLWYVDTTTLNYASPLEGTYTKVFTGLDIYDNGVLYDLTTTISKDDFRVSNGQNFDYALANEPTYDENGDIVLEMKGSFDDQDLVMWKVDYDFNPALPSVTGIVYTDIASNVDGGQNPVGTSSGGSGFTSNETRTYFQSHLGAPAYPSSLQITAADEVRKINFQILNQADPNNGAIVLEDSMLLDFNVLWLDPVEPSTGCDLTINMADSFGDGWNGNTLDIYVNGELVSAGNTIESGASATATISTNYGDTVLFDMIEYPGFSYISETSFTVVDSNGNTVASGGGSATGDATFECLDPDAVNLAASVATDGALATFSFDITNFVIDPQDTPLADGHGHIHWSIFESSDLATAIQSGMLYSAEDITVPLPNGNHTMVFSLVDNGHTALDPAVESIVVFSTFDGTVACDSSYTYTYGDNESGILFTSTNPDGGAVTVTMTGQTETCCDEVVITDGAGNELYNLGGDHTGVSVTSEDGTINISIVSDSSWSPGGNGLGNGTEMTFDITCATVEEAALSLQGIMDIDVSGGVGKGVHLVATSDIADLSVYGLGSANNQQGTDGQEFTLSGSILAGQNILVTNSSADATGADVFLDGYLAGHTFDLIINGAGQALQGNGNDAYELYFNDAVVETFGVTGNVGDPSQSSDYSMDWAYNDSWAYKVDDVWTYGGPNCTDGSNTTCSSDCPYPFVICSSDPVFHDITFTVDARNILVRDRGMYVGGGIFGSADAHAMSDEDGDGVWSVVISLEEGATYTSGNPAGNFGFFNSPMDGGDWGTKENIEGLECADADNYSDRILPAINADTAEIAYCFATCDTGCDPLATRHDVTFNVDTNNIEVGTEGMWLGGGIMGSGKAHQLFDEDGDGVYTRVLSMLEGTTGNWVFLNSPPNHYEYGGKEDLGGQDCAVGQYNDRLLDPVTGAAEYTFCFASCDVSCSSGPVAIVAPWSDDFEDGDVSDWTQFQAGDESTGWTLLDGEMTHSDDDVANGVDNYFISPLLNCTGLTEPLLTYTEYQTYANTWYVYHSVSYSEDYNGENAATATWTELTNGPAPYDAETFEFAIPNTATAVAFRYSGDYADNWFVDNVSVTETPGEPNAVDSNPDQEWGGYMSVFDLNADGTQGGYLFGSAWGVADLQTTLNVDTPNIVLEPNFNAYANAIADGSAGELDYWTDGAGGGNKFMEATTQIESTETYNGADLTFTGSVYENTLIEGYNAVYFIKCLDPNNGYSDMLDGAYVLPIVAGEFSVTVDGSMLPEGKLVQYGFTVYGPNANAENDYHGRVVIGEAGLSVSNNTPLEMVIYPNPSNGSYVTIQTPVNGVKYVEVFDITGKRLINTSLSADTLDVSSMSAGLYLVKVTVEGQSKASKLIIR